MLTLRTLLAGLAACLPRDEAQAARAAARAEIHEKRTVIVAKPTCYYRVAQSRAHGDPLAEEDQVETLSLGS